MTEKTYQQKKIIDLLTSMYSDFFDLQILIEKEQFSDYSTNFDHIDHKDSLEKSFKGKAKILYNVCAVYFESLNLKDYLNDFKNEIIIRLNDSKLLLESELTDYDTIPYSTTLSLFRKYIVPFEFSNSLEQPGLIYLENILESTYVIIKELNRKPNSETKVYNSVKFVIKTVFPEFIDSSLEPFYKLAKCYKPDILIPSLNTAIEYKYARDEKTLVKTVDEILIDVEGYSDHSTYKFFYAVFYVEVGVCTKERFQLIWNQRHFPSNWKPIFVLGN